MLSQRAVVEGDQESRTRSRAKRRGLALRKDRARTRSINHQGGYMLVDPYKNSIVAGERYDLSLAAVEDLLA